MKVFITGGTGWVGTGIIRELVAAKHQVTALVRSTSGAEHVTALGATPRTGDLTDLDVLRATASEADAAIHCAFSHVFGARDGIGSMLVRLTGNPNLARISTVAGTDIRAIEAMRDGLLAGPSPHKVLISTSGIAGLLPGSLGTEATAPNTSALGGIRIASEQVTIAAASRGVKSASIRLPPSVHGAGDKGFVSNLIDIAKRTGVSGYVGDGANHWPAVHRDDAAVLYRLAMEGLAAGTVPAGSVLHGVAEQGVPFRELAAAIASQAGNVESAARKPGHFGWFLGMVVKADLPASSELTRRLTGWKPSQPTLVDDVRSAAYAR